MSQPSMFATVVDEEGRAIWNVSPDTIRFEQLVRAADLGALGGEADRIYLILLPPSGNGVYLDWNALLQALQVTWDLLDAISTVAGAAAGIEFVRRKVKSRISQGREAITRNAPDWSQRHALPHDVSALLKRQSWSTSEAALL